MNTSDGMVVADLRNLAIYGALSEQHLLCTVMYVSPKQTSYNTYYQRHKISYKVIFSSNYFSLT